MHNHILNQFQWPILRRLSLAVGAIYLLRAIIGPYYWETPTFGSLLFGGLSASYFCYSAIVSKIKAHKHFTFTLITLASLSECINVYVNYESYLTFFILIPVYIMATALLSGQKYAILTTLLITIQAFVIVQAPDQAASLFLSTGHAPYLAVGLALILAQLITIYLIVNFLNMIHSSRQDLLDQRLNRVRTNRKLAMAETIGKAAHELNNPIAILDSALRLLPLRWNDPQTLQSTFAAMRGAQVRLKSVIQSIQTFAQGDLKEEMTPVSVQELIKSFQKSTQEKLRPSAATLVVQNLASQRTVLCRPSQTHFVLNTLLENALDAIEGTYSMIELTVCEQGLRVRFELRDYGRGIPERLVDSIFSPFVTTKPVGKTMGMNLSLARVFIEEQGGSIGFERLDKGTCFWFELKTKS